MIIAGSDNHFPVHIGIIMDGNGRWAKKRMLPRSAGHRAGAEAMRRTCDACRKLGVKYVTFYTFSTENWKRPKDEIDTLMTLFEEYLDKAESFTGKKARILFLGDKSPFPITLRDRMEELEKNSAAYDSMTIMFAMNYGGRDDIVHAARQITEYAVKGDISPADVDENLLQGLLYTKGAPDADLIIRTSGEQRLSNFLLWQSAYAEFYFTDVLWPDFGEKELKAAIDSFMQRQRRFGGV